MLIYEKTNKYNCLDFDNINAFVNDSKIIVNNSLENKIEKEDSTIKELNILNNEENNSYNNDENNESNEIYSDISSDIIEDIKEDNIYDSNNFEDFINDSNNKNLKNNMDKLDSLKIFECSHSENILSNNNLNIKNYIDVF